MTKQSTLSTFTVRIAFVSTLAVSLAGCAAALFGGAASTMAVANDPRTTGSFVEDQAIELKARKTISEHKDLDSQTHINITSYNQIALVTGEAPTEALRRQAIELIRRVDKVRHVYDEIQIAAPTSFMSRSNDTLLTTKVKTKLFATKDVDATQVKVVTEGGIVYLLGLVPETEGNLVAQAASHVKGVKKIVKLFETIPEKDAS